MSTSFGRQTSFETRHWDANSDEPNRHLVSNINISRVTAELGYTSTVSSDTAIGIALSNLYKKTHGERPKKVPVNCNGQVRPLCNYTENERVMMEQCIREYFEKKGKKTE
jgi:hypothetical protein